MDRKFKNQLLVFIVLIVASSCVIANAYESKFNGPKLTSVERVDEFILEIKWLKVENAKNLTRYRLFYIRNDDDKYREWPAQIIRADTIAAETRDYVPLSFDSAFDCYTNCIKNPVCTFAVYKSIVDRLSDENCFLKTDEKYSNNIKSNLFDENSEYVRVPDYTNEATLKGISTFDNYSFSIFVYDVILDAWSSESNMIEYKGQPLGVDLECEAKDKERLKLSWKKSTKFTVSRYNVILSLQDSPNSQSIPVLIGLSKFEFDPNYYDTTTIDESAGCEREEDCFKKCVNMPDCVRYMYNKESEACKLSRKFDSSDGRLVPMNAVAFSVKSEAEEFILNNKLVKSGNYTIKIEFIDSFGVSRYSNSINVTINRNDDEDEIEEKKTISIKSDTGENIYLNEIDDEIVDYRSKTGANSAKKTTINSDLIIKSNTSHKLTLNQNSTQILKVNEPFSVSCSWSGSPNTQLVWAKKGDTRRGLSVKKSSFDQGSTYELIFSKLSREDEGIYTCSLEQDAHTYLDLNLTIKDVPSKPIIEKFNISKDEISITWSLGDDGGLELTSGLIEFSPNFKNSSIPVDSYELSETDLKKNQTWIKKSINSDTYVRIRFDNSFGKGKTSDVRLIKSKKETNKTVVIKQKSQKIAKNAEQIKADPTEIRNNSDKGSKHHIVYSISVLIALILIPISFLYFCKKNKRSQPKKENGKKENAESDKNHSEHLLKETV